ncbi:MAG: hypothetical protein J6Q02_03295 [Lachnospiraceae bacterium]|nr:hypothetical protein [Lachnospiraceae bacterium]
MIALVVLYAVAVLVVAAVSFGIDALIMSNTNVTDRTNYVFSVNLFMSVLAPVNFMLVNESLIVYVIFAVNRLIVRPLIKTFFYSKISMAPKRKILLTSMASEAIMGVLVVIIVRCIA